MNRLLHRRQMQGHLPFPYRGVSDTQTISNARGGICRPFYMARNTVRKVLAAPCFYVSSKKLKIFWSKSPEAMSISDGQRKKLHFLKSANLFVYQIYLITPHGHLVKACKNRRKNFVRIFSCGRYCICTKYIHLQEVDALSSPDLARRMN